MNKQSSKPIAAVIGAAFALGGTAAYGSVFQVTDLGAGYMVAQATPANAPAKAGGDKAHEGKCGEGKCGGQKPAAAKSGEGKCGEGKCGGDKAAHKTADKAGEGKCGEGKCGGDKK